MRCARPPGCAARRSFARPGGGIGLWQGDFSEYETAAGGRWNFGGVVDYWAKVNLACAVTVRKTTSDAISVFEATLAEVETLLGVTGSKTSPTPPTGEIATLRLVTDNGSLLHVGALAAWVAAKHHITHIRTRRRAPWTNGMIERFLRSHQIRAPLPARHRRRRRNSPTRSPPTARSTTRSDPTKRSPCADPSSATDRRRPPNPQTPKLSRLLDTRQDAVGKQQLAARTEGSWHRLGST